MASGDTMFMLDPKSYLPPAANYATLDVIADSSTPGLNIPVLDFDATTSETAYWIRQVPSNYDGGGFTFSWKGGTDNTSTGTLELEFRVLKVADATDLSSDLGIDGQTAATVTDTPPATPADKLNYSTTENLSHANAGSPSVGDFVVIAATRDTATDTNTGDLQLAAVLVTET